MNEKESLNETSQAAVKEKAEQDPSLRTSYQLATSTPTQSKRGKEALEQQQPALCT